MNRKPFIQIGDKITTKKFGRWTIVNIDDEYITMVKIRKGKITETFRISQKHLFS